MNVVESRWRLGDLLDCKVENGEAEHDQGEHQGDGRGGEVAQRNEGRSEDELGEYGEGDDHRKPAHDPQSSFGDEFSDRTSVDKR